jgi:hypothetical protein
LFTYTQPVDVLQLSLVQMLLSSQLRGGPPRQAPPPQVSLVVHASLSSQGSLLFTWAQPLDGLQLSSVQGLLSLQFADAPGTHAPPLHVSAVVQALPSLHGAVLEVCAHPVAGLQPSSVHTLLSLQSGGGPPVQDPPLHVSFVVHKFPSSHTLLLLT